MGTSFWGKTSAHSGSKPLEPPEQEISPSPDQARKKPFWQRHVWILIGLWLGSLLIDRLWFALDQSVPAWDQADYLNGALGYWRMLGEGDRFSPDWWQAFWLAAPKIPPLAYLFTLPFFALLGPGIKTAPLVHALYSALLIGGVYGLGKKLFHPRVGLWAAAICLLLPGLYPLRLEYLLDYPVAAMVTFTFFLMTGWYRAQTLGRGWVRAIATGFCIGLCILTKQTALLFLLSPLLLLGLEALVRRRWGRLLQGVTAGAIAFVLIRPWVVNNWLLILTSSKRATLDSAVKEGDPSLLSPSAWLYYLQQFPAQVGWPIFVGAIAGFLFLTIRALLRLRSDRPSAPELLPRSGSLPWLLTFLIGAYLLNSLNPNKDPRYITPYLPVLSLLLAYGFSLWPRRLNWVPGGAIALAALAFVVNIFPLGVPGAVAAQILTPGSLGRQIAEVNRDWPHRQIIAKIVETEPNFRTTLGVLPSTPGINQHNLSLFGNLAGYRVAGRQVGTKTEDVIRDVRSLSWFLTKTGDQGSIPAAQPTIVNAVTTSPEFEALAQWLLPDASEVQLWHRKTPRFSLSPAPPNTAPEIKLLSANLPAQARPDQPVAVTYRWSGSIQNFQDSVLAINWRPISTGRLERGWLHDHGPALGTVQLGPDQSLNDVVILTERLAMLPSGSPGTYQLGATWLDRRLPEETPPRLLAVPTVQLTLDPAAEPQPAPELDWLTQLRTWAKLMPKGPDAFGPAFEDIGRVNQYVATQDYLEQAEISLRYRLGQVTGAEQLDDAYALALTKVLQQDVEGAIAALQTVTTLDEDNPFAHAYLAFVHLYGLEPRNAERALEPAKAIAPQQSEIQILDGVAGLMRGNLWKAWRTIQSL